MRTVLEPLLPLLMFKLTFAIFTSSCIYLVLSALALSRKKKCCGSYKMWKGMETSAPSEFIWTGDWRKVETSEGG